VSLLAATLVAVVVLDGASKHVAVRRLVPGRLYGVGGAWGLRRTDNRRGGRAGLAVGPAAAVLAVLAVGLTVLAGTPLLSVAGGLVLGGATANLAERVRRGAVMDFVALGPWPAFNVADAAMVLGLMAGVAGAR
jgi:signal peptidase II